MNTLSTERTQRAGLFLLSFITFSASLVCSGQVVPGLGATVTNGAVAILAEPLQPPTVIRRGPNERVWQRPATGTNGFVATGQDSGRTYIEVGAGLTYLDDSGQYQDSRDVIDLLPNGGAASLYAPTKTYFSPNLNEGGISLVTASNHLQLRPLGLFYYDAASGKMARISTVCDSIGELQPPNQVIYKSAMAPLRADFRLTATRAATESDLIILQQPRPPEAYGLNPATTRLELWHAVTSDIEPRTRINTLSRENDPALRQLMGAEADVVDEFIQFDQLVLPLGKAFSCGSEPPRDTNAAAAIRLPRPNVGPGETIVAKRLLEVDGTRVLVESVRWADVREQLQALPLTAGAPEAPATPDSGEETTVTGRKAMLASLKATPAKPELAAVKKPIRIAAAAYNPKGFTLDYVTVTSDGDRTFESGITYLINYGYFSGQLVFQPNCILKFPPSQSLLVYAPDTPVIFNGTAQSPSILTSHNDDQYGDVISGSTGIPSYGADVALWFYYVNYSASVQGLRVRWARTGVQYDCSGSGSLGIQDSAFEMCDTGIRAASVSIYNSTKCGVNWPVAGDSSGELVEVCGGPPVIQAHPASQIVAAGATASFTVIASGSAPLAYQWYKDGQAIPGATSTTLTVANAQAANVGYYSVAVANGSGSAQSGNAPLGIVGSPLPPAPGLAAWWRAEGNAFDAGPYANHAVFTGPYSSGNVGQAFSVTSAGTAVRVPASSSLNVGTGDGLTIEGWIKPFDTSARPFVEWSFANSYGAHVWVNFPSAGYIWVNLFGTDNLSHNYQSPPGLVASGSFQHIAVTYDCASGKSRLFVNGSLKQTEPLGSFTPQTAPDLYLGFRPAYGGVNFNGLIDEASIYNRALSPAEIQGICNTAGAGKCADADTDGLPDLWEMRYFGNLVQTGSADYDGDGLTNLQEYQLNTSPVLADTGATGTTDSYKDADNDGLTNFEEFNLGTDPLQPNVAAPAFNPLGGSYSSARSVTITCPTPGATIHYTLDGTEPSEVTSPSYSAPVPVDHNLTLKAKAWKTGWVNSDTETESYRIEDPPWNQPPTVTLLPPTGTSLLASDSIEILVEAGDSDGTISKLQLFHGNFKVAEATSSPLRYTLANLPAGSYTFTAKAIDDDGAVTVSAAAVFTVNASAPVVSLAGIQPFFTSSPGTLLASVTGVNPAALTSLTVNGNPLPPRAGQFPLTVSLVEGENTFTLAATDNQNRTAQATAKVYLDSILPVVSITAPANNSSFGSTRINVTGTFTETSLKRITVNGVLAFVSGNSWEALNVPLAEGANTLTATAEDLSGNTTSATRTVTGVAPLVDPVQLTAMPVGGFAPLQVTLIPQSSAPGTLQQVLFDFNGDNIVDQTAANLNQINQTYSVAGEYFPVVTIVTSSGRFSSVGGWNGDVSRLRINVQTPPNTLNTIAIVDPVDLKCAANGHLYVLSRSTAIITEYDADLAVYRSKSAIGTTPTPTPTGLDVDTDGNVYVALSGENHVAKFKPVPGTFELDLSFGASGLIGTTGAGNGQFNTPYDVSVAPNGQEIAVSDSGNHRIQRFRTDSGAFMDSAGGQGSALGQYNTPKGLAFDAAGYLYIVDSGNNRVVLTLSSAAIGASGSSGTGLGQFGAAVNLGVGSRGIYVADTGNNRVQAFDPISGAHGASVTPFTARVALSTQLGLHQPAAAAPAADLLSENIFVADTGNNRVLKVAIPESATPAETWNLMVQQLTAATPDVEAATSNFSQMTAEDYRQGILTIGTDKVRLDMNAVGALTPVFIENDKAQYYFEQTIEGRVFLFPVEFVKENGVWKVLEF